MSGLAPTNPLELAALRRILSSTPMQVLARYLQKLPGQTRAVGETCFYGLAAGAATVAFQLGMNWLYRLGLVRLSHQSMTTFLIGSFAVIVTSSLLVGWLLSLLPRGRRQRHPPAELAFWKEFGTVPWRIAWVKFVAGILSIGGGSSLGREGPSVQLAGAVASNLSGFAGTAKQKRRAAAAAGASAAWHPPSTLPGGHYLCP